MSDARQERVAYMDVARALGVLGVILGHAWYGSLAERVTLSFDLALFFFVSGFVYSEKYSARPDVLVVRRLRTLYLPFVRWGLFWLALHNVLIHAGIYSETIGYLGRGTPLYDFQGFLRAAFRIVTFRGTEPMAGALWFLASLFQTNVLFGVTSFVWLKLGCGSREWVRGLAVTALAAAGYASNPLLGNRVFIGTSLVALLVFYWGVLYRQYHGRIPLRWYLALPAAAIVIAAGGGVYFGANEYAHPLLLVTVVPAGIYASLFLSKLWEKNWFLNYVGTNTIFIIGTHILAFKLVALIQIWVDGHPFSHLAKYPVITGSGGWWIAYFLSGLLIPVAAKLGIDRLMATVRRGKDQRTE